MGDLSPERKSGCGLFGAVFGGRTSRPRKSPSPTPAQYCNLNLDYDSSDSPNLQNDHKQGDRVIHRPGPNYTPQPAYQPHRSPHNPPRNASPSTQGYKKVPQAGPGFGLSGELDTMIKDHQRSKGAGNMVRASSGNVMLYSNLGNLRQPGNSDNGNARTEEPLLINGKSSMVNVGRKNEECEKSDFLCRGLSTRMDPEQLKILGNEDYKNGRFAEALALYEAAISIDPNKASYRSNKSAALTAMGHLLEAAFECKEAIRIDSSYQRAHNRLATLYVRLGEPEKGLYHFKQAGPEADPDDMNMAAKVQSHLNKCTKAKRQRDWNTLLKEIGLSTTTGADSAPLIMALKAEALLKLNRHQEAIQTMANGPNFSIDECTKFFGPIATASLLVSQAQVSMAEGRFDDASVAAERACRLDINNREATSVMRRARDLALARSKGNDLFKAGRYEEACATYGEGLDQAPYNSLFLCNRAACQAKLSSYEKAIEDCSAALHVRPGYIKARLRRADCYAKIKNWRACLQDSEVLIRENPEDEEVMRIFNEAKAQMNLY